MHNEKGRSYGSKTETNDKDKNVNKLALGAAAIAVGGAAAFGIAHVAGSEAQAISKPEISTQYENLSEEVASQLLTLQEANEHGVAANEIPASLHLQSIDNITISTDIITDATIAYESTHEAMPKTVEESIRLTAHAWEDEKRENGESAHPQPGQELGFATYVGDDGNEYAVVSDPAKIDTE